MRLNVCYSETAYYDDEVTFTDEQVKEMLDEVGIPENEREELFSDLDELLDAVLDSQIFHDYLSESLTFKTVDTDNFQYDYMNLIREKGE